VSNSSTITDAIAILDGLANSVINDFRFATRTRVNTAVVAPTATTGLNATVPTVVAAIVVSTLIRLVTVIHAKTEALAIR
jgi:hypothetical protein